jgi:hypothetical protein
VVALILSPPAGAKSVEVPQAFADLVDATPPVKSKGADALQAFAKAGELYAFEQRMEFGFSAMLDPAWIEERLARHYDELAAELAKDKALSAQLELRPLLWRVDLVGLKTTVRIWTVFEVKKSGKGFVTLQAGLGVAQVAFIVVALLAVASVLGVTLQGDAKEVSQSIAYGVQGLPTSYVVDPQSGELKPVQPFLSKLANPLVAVPLAIVVLVGGYFAAPLLRRLFK